MIEIEKLNGDRIYLNYFQILCLEQIPETKIVLMSGDYYLVKNSVEDIMKKIETFLRNCFRGTDLYHEREDLKEFRS